MSWADFYLVCFVTGGCLSLVTFLAGGVHVHVPHFHSHLPSPGAHGAAAHGASTAGAKLGAAKSNSSPLNLLTLTAFLAWFGGTGYLLARHSTLWFLAALLVSIVSGIGGAAVIYLFLTRILSAPDEELDPADFEMVGVLGRLSVRIREGGTGELIYPQAGTRRVCAARSENGSGIAKGSEVVVTRYEHGIAYVRPWSELMGEDVDAADSEPQKKETPGRPQ
jgi:membrane protein implicated in regulation of membrane protease activity